MIGVIWAVIVLIGDVMLAHEIVITRKSCVIADQSSCGPWTDLPAKRKWICHISQILGKNLIVGEKEKFVLQIAYPARRKYPLRRVFRHLIRPARAVLPLPHGRSKCVWLLFRCVTPQTACALGQQHCVSGQIPCA